MPRVPGHTQFLDQIRVKTYVGTPSFLGGHTQFLSLNVPENAGAHPLSKTWLTPCSYMYYYYIAEMLVFQAFAFCVAVTYSCKHADVRCRSRIWFSWFSIFTHNYNAWGLQLGSSLAQRSAYGQDANEQVNGVFFSMKTQLFPSIVAHLCKILSICPTAS